MSYTVKRVMPHPNKKGSTTLEKITIAGVEVSTPTRKSARHWCRSNYYRIDHHGFVIIHPDGTKEDFVYNGVL